LAAGSVAAVRRVFKYVTGVLNEAFPISHAVFYASDIHALLQERSAEKPSFESACDALAVAIKDGLVPPAGLDALSGAIRNTGDSALPVQLLRLTHLLAQPSLQTRSTKDEQKDDAADDDHDDDNDEEEEQQQHHDIVVGSETLSASATLCSTQGRKDADEKECTHGLVEETEEEPNAKGHIMSEEANPEVENGCGDKQKPGCDEAHDHAAAQQSAKKVFKYVSGVLNKAFLLSHVTHCAADIKVLLGENYSG
jgi:hypothetical protein